MLSPICLSVRPSVNKSKIVFTLDSIYAIARICYCRSVCQTGGSYKMVELRIMKFSPYGSPIPLVFAGQVSSKNFKGSPERGTK